jgi:hypothetical protein
VTPAIEPELEPVQPVVSVVIGPMLEPVVTPVEPAVDAGESVVVTPVLEAVEPGRAEAPPTNDQVVSEITPRDEPIIGQAIPLNEPVLAEATPLNEPPVGQMTALDEPVVDEPPVIDSVLEAVEPVVTPGIESTLVEPVVSLANERTNEHATLIDSEGAQREQPLDVFGSPIRLFSHVLSELWKTACGALSASPGTTSSAQACLAALLFFLIPLVSNWFRLSSLRLTSAFFVRPVSPG